MNYLNLIRSYTRYLFFAVLHSFFSGYGQTFFIALFVPLIRSDFKLGITEFGLYYSGATLVSALALPYTGRLIDQIHLRIYSAGVGLMLLVSLLLMGLTQNLAILIIGIILLRHSGQSLMGHIASTAMARYFDKLRGKALGLSSLGHPLGEAILPLFVTQMMGGFGWRFTFFTLAAGFLVIFFPSLLLVHSRDPFLLPPGQKPAPSEMENLHWNRREVLRSKFFYFVLPLAVFPPFLATGLFFHQGVLAQYKGWEMSWIAACFVGFAAFRVLGSFLIGPGIDRYSARVLYPLHLIPLILGLIVLGLSRHPMAAFLYLSCLGLSIGFEFNIKTALWAEVYGTKHLGAIKSMALTIVIFSTAISPPLFGWLLEKYGINFDQLVFLMTGVAVVVSLLAALAPPVKKKN